MSVILLTFYTASIYHLSSYCHLFYLEYVNAKKLQQDHPCVLHIIRSAYMHNPVSKTVPYKLSKPNVKDPSVGQSRAILRLLHNQVSIDSTNSKSYLNRFL